MCVTGAPRPAPGFDVMRPTSEPALPATHHMIDARVIAARKPTAYLINLARGGILDETALSKHCA